MNRSFSPGSYFDEQTPIAETVSNVLILASDLKTDLDFKMRALHDVVQAGHARYIGMAPCWAYQCMLSANVSNLMIRN